MSSFVLLLTLVKITLVDPYIHIYCVFLHYEVIVAMWLFTHEHAIDLSIYLFIYLSI